MAQRTADKQKDVFMRADFSAPEPDLQKHLAQLQHILGTRGSSSDSTVQSCNRLYT